MDMKNEANAATAPAAKAVSAKATTATKAAAKVTARMDPEYVADQQAQRDTDTRFDATRFRRIEDAVE